MSVDEMEYSAIKLKKQFNETKEAVIQFELYRFLINSMDFKRRFGSIRYSHIEPEAPAGTGGADLVIKAEINGSPNNILVIEVKKRTDRGYLVWDDEVRKQAKTYAETLSAPYYAVTDGQCLRLFKTQNEEYVENCKFSIDKNTAGLLLKGLSDLHEGKASRLPFDIIRPPTEEIEKLSTGFTRMLLDLFQELSGKGTISVTVHGRVKYLNIERHKGVLRLNLDKEPTEVAIDIRLNTLRKALGNKFTKMIKELSEIPGFQWVQDGADSKYNIWKLVKNIVTMEPVLSDVCEGLRKWLLELDRIQSSSRTDSTTIQLHANNTD